MVLASGGALAWVVMARFSKRTGWDVSESEFAAAVREARAAGERLIDLTVSNPTVCGFSYDGDAVLGGLGMLGRCV